jgi:large subunit ribosomal protein L20
MPRATSSPAVRRRRKRLLKSTKGYWGNASRLPRYAKQARDRAGQFAYRDRRKKKTTMRQLWIIRINAACRANDISYSHFMNGLKKADIEMDRKALSELAIHNEAAFNQLIAYAKEALKAA